MTEEQEARIKKETRKIVRMFNQQEFACPDGCTAKYFHDVVRSVIVKKVKAKLKYRKWAELYSLDYYSILHQVNDELDKYFDWK